MFKLFLLFLLVPAIELYFLIEIGSVIGAGFTIFMVVLTAVIGAALVRYQGVTTLARAQTELIKKRVPAMEVMEGALILLAGAMLLIPGFFSDAMGFVLLISPLRRWLVQRYLKNRVVSVGGHVDTTQNEAGNRRVIDVDYKDLD